MTLNGLRVNPLHDGPVCPAGSDDILHSYQVITIHEGAGTMVYILGLLSYELLLVLILEESLQLHPPQLQMRIDSE